MEKKIANDAIIYYFDGNGFANTWCYAEDFAGKLIVPLEDICEEKEDGTYYMTVDPITISKPSSTLDSFKSFRDFYGSGAMFGMIAIIPVILMIGMLIGVMAHWI